MSSHVGSLVLVLHTHLPRLLGHGRWPVGEEWLYQAWAQSYLPVLGLLEELAAQGLTEQLTLGVTPVLAEQLDDPVARDGLGAWLADWRWRGLQLARDRNPGLATVGAYEVDLAERGLRAWEGSWRAGLSPLLRRLYDSGVVEVLGGPYAHPFQPFLPPQVMAHSLRRGLDDHATRLGARPSGVWLPECAWTPAMEQVLASAGIGHTVLDGPTLQHVGADLATPWLLGDSDVAVLGRDLSITYRVWSPRRGYPGGRWYRDFHAWHHESGTKAYRVTGAQLDSEHKAPYEPTQAVAAARADAADFVTHVRERLCELGADQNGSPPVLLAAYDTELFGHWWHEGPQFLAEVLRLLPTAGVRPTTLGAAVRDHKPAGRIVPAPGSWGRGKDFRVWDNDAVRYLRNDWNTVCAQLVELQARVAREPGFGGYRRWQFEREALLTLASDWTFLISSDGAAQYARERHSGHLKRAQSFAQQLGLG